MEVKTDIEIAQENEMYPITEIAEQVGIPNTSYFYRQFKKATGKTPQRYRE